MIRRSSPPRRRSPLARSTTPIKKKPRKASEFQRIYGSRERVAFVAALPCVGCRIGAPCENHHIQTDGLSRKADYTRVVPLCRPCHREIHRLGRFEFARQKDVDLRAAAVMTEAKWIAHSVKVAVDSNIRGR